jgi:hypothetical protein
LLVLQGMMFFLGIFEVWFLGNMLIRTFPHDSKYNEFNIYFFVSFNMELYLVAFGYNNLKSRNLKNNC